MQYTSKLCPYCGAPLARGARICRACDRPVPRHQPVSQTPSSESEISQTMAAGHGLDDLLTRQRPLRNPYWPALYVGWGLIGLTLMLVLGVSAMVLAGAWSSAVLLAASIPWMLFSLMQVIIWLLGVWKLGRIRAFLESSRPEVRWVYTPAEWRALQAEHWEDSQGDWKIQLGCMTLLLGIAGALTGFFIGVEEGAVESLAGALAGAVAGAGVGSIIGGVVAGANHLVTRLKQQDLPAEVALAPNEFFYDDDYFKANGITHRLEGVELQPGDPAILIIETWSQRVRGPGETTWTISVPARRLPQVRALLPRFQTSTDANES